MRMHFHELTRVQLPSPIAPGRLRRAVIADLDVITAWTDAFSPAIGEPVDAAQLARADLTNPTSNSIYRQLGYRVIGDASAHALE